MNGKKAKLLRGMAGGSPTAEEPTKYMVVPHMTRTRKVKDLLGEVIAEYQTHTLKCAPGVRMVNKALKKMYRAGSRR